MINYLQVSRVWLDTFLLGDIGRAKWEGDPVMHPWGDAKRCLEVSHGAKHCPAWVLRTTSRPQSLSSKSWMKGRGWKSRPILQFILRTGQTGVNTCVSMEDKCAEVDFWIQLWSSRFWLHNLTSLFKDMEAELYDVWTVVSSFRLVFRCRCGIQRISESSLASWVHPLPCECLHVFSGLMSSVIMCFFVSVQLSWTCI